jgi:hypothetical protein
MLGPGAEQPGGESAAQLEEQRAALSAGGTAAPRSRLPAWSPEPG